MIDSNPNGSIHGCTGAAMVADIRQVAGRLHVGAWCKANNKPMPVVPIGSAR